MTFTKKKALEFTLKKIISINLKFVVKIIVFLNFFNRSFDKKIFVGFNLYLNQQNLII